MFRQPCYAPVSVSQTSADSGLSRGLFYTASSWPQLADTAANAHSAHAPAVWADIGPS